MRLNSKVSTYTAMVNRKQEKSQTLAMVCLVTFNIRLLMVHYSEDATRMKRVSGATFTKQCPLPGVTTEVVSKMPSYMYGPWSKVVLFKGN